MSDERTQENQEVKVIDPRQMLPGEDLRDHLERLHSLGLLNFKPGCSRCNDCGCIACYP